MIYNPYTVITMFTWTVVVLWGDNSNIAGFGSKLYISNKIVRGNARQVVKKVFNVSTKAFFSLSIQFVQIAIQNCSTQVTELQNFYLSEQSSINYHNSYLSKEQSRNFFFN